MPDWFDNDDLFLAQLRTGHDFASFAAQALRSEGLAVEVTPMEVREDIRDRHGFSDEFDLLVGRSRPCRIDVKSRALSFTCMEDYPYESAFVDTVSGWNGKHLHPLAIVLVSQLTGAMVTVPSSTSPEWWIETRFDRERQMRDRFYMVSTARLRPFEDLVRWLRVRED